MVTAPDVADRNARPLDADDLEAVIAIDRAHSGRARRRFFEKRFAAAAAQPDEYVHLGTTRRGGSLCGYAMARILRGEFGHEGAVAVLDAIGVESESRERGIGHVLMEQLCELLRGRGVRSVQSQAEWTNHDLLRFFAASGFQIAPRLALQCSTSALLRESSEDV
jgi:L-amino acid N-acyltransferase YncA